MRNIGPEGATANERKIVPEVEAPSQSFTGGYNLQGSQDLHVFVELTGGAVAAQATPYFYSAIAGRWFEGEPLMFDPDTQYHRVDAAGEKVAFVVNSVG